MDVIYLKGNIAQQFCWCVACERLFKASGVYRFLRKEHKIINCIKRSLKSPTSNPDLENGNFLGKGFAKGFHVNLF